MRWDPLSLVENLGRDPLYDGLHAVITCWKCRSKPCLTRLESVAAAAAQNLRGYRKPA